jgi:hypothetical protein
VEAVARGYLKARLSVIPIAADGSKAPRPGFAWKKYQTERASMDQLGDWFISGDCGIAIVAGVVSGGLEVIDFDAPDLLGPWAELVEAEVPGLVDSLPIVETPTGGSHLYYRCATIEGNQKLAVRQDADPDTSKPKSKTLIETRGERGYVLAPGCPPGCHPSGGSYRHKAGPPLIAIPTVTPEEREILLRAARSFHQPTEDSHQSNGAPSNGEQRPGDEYNRRGSDWKEILTDWHLVHVCGGVRYWRRPGKNGRGWSATTGFCRGPDGTDRLAVFSSNAAPFEGPNSKNPCSVYSKFSAYALLHHQGDFRAAAEELARQGYGQPHSYSTTSANADGGPVWPEPPGEDAYHGPAGEIVRAFEPQSEADPVAFLVQILVMFGNAIGRTANFVVEGDAHYFNLFSTLVGKSSRARKGTATGRVRQPFAEVDPEWAGTRTMGGLSSGQGLIWNVRDPSPARGKIEADPGEPDKRVLILEPEFASVLRQIEGERNILSAILRQAWDSGDLRTLTTGRQLAPVKATGAHISVVGHITAEELRRYLSSTEAASGFGNRFLWLCVKRSKLLPEGGQPVDLARLVEKLRQSIAFGRTTCQMRRDPEAAQLWAQVYPTLSADKPGLAGALTARAEAQVLRLSCIYALLDLSAVIRPEHLRAAIALWEYAERSVAFIFGDSLGDPVADELLRLLRSSPNGLTRTEIRDYFQRNVSADRIGRALGLLLQHGLARKEEQDNGAPGRRAERWYAVRQE